VERSVIEGIGSAGKGVLMTALTMLLGLAFWGFSFLRFQAEMGMLLLFWLSVSMLGGLVLLPAILVQLKPRFVFGAMSAEGATRSPSAVRTSSPRSCADRTDP
jgi:uncharacterized protein